VVVSIHVTFAFVHVITVHIYKEKYLYCMQVRTRLDASKYADFIDAYTSGKRQRQLLAFNTIR